MNINLTLIGQMITFAIFVAFTMKYVWPPLRVAMTERKKKIAEGLAQSDRAQKELESAQRQAAEIINEAKTQSTVIIEQANERAHRVDEEAKEEARLAANRIKDAALSEIDSEKLRVRDQLMREVAEIAILGAEKVVGNQFDKKANDRALEKLMAEI
ncbi:F0F1 ATP synthase subunit B [Thiotrichales bacterium 19S11-10]|nr:F0F1 ATP synthase subunit B [Thiotrichales bacterium 19S11-10]MCF6807551.1 F0F1 ATP synthase subunit B [Thiotrichales bacterium 19S9-11]MCF6811520.1 F0F1 ATP synthase subunit B [Thiotrichales bacterium 19S9-12]